MRQNLKNGGNCKKLTQEFYFKSKIRSRNLTSLIPSWYYTHCTMYLALPKILSEDLSYSINRVVPWSVFQLMFPIDIPTQRGVCYQPFGWGTQQGFLLKYLFFNLFFLKNNYKWKKGFCWKCHCHQRGSSSSIPSWEKK